MTYCCLDADSHFREWWFTNSSCPSPAFCLFSGCCCLRLSHNNFQPETKDRTRLGVSCLHHQFAFVFEWKRKIDEENKSRKLKKTKFWQMRKINVTDAPIYPLWISFGKHVSTSTINSKHWTATICNNIWFRDWRIETLACPCLGSVKSKFSRRHAYAYSRTLRKTIYQTQLIDNTFGKLRSSLNGNMWNMMRRK